MEAKREKALVKQYSLQLKDEKARQKEVRRQAVWVMQVCLTIVLSTLCTSLVFVFLPVLIGKEEKKRRKLKTSRRERTQSWDCSSGMSTCLQLKEILAYSSVPRVSMLSRFIVIFQSAHIWVLCLICFSDPEYVKDQEDEEETSQKDWEARHAGSAAEVTEAEWQTHKETEELWPRFNLKSRNKCDKIYLFWILTHSCLPLIYLLKLHWGWGGALVADSIFISLQTHFSATVIMLVLYLWNCVWWLMGCELMVYSELQKWESEIIYEQIVLQKYIFEL